ncbi:MAG TPA: hypothetical protein VIY28_00415 [Pseudonocardiaceae bacterium]
MTPRRLDPSIVQARLSALRGLLDDLADVDAAGELPLAENRMLRYGVERILTQLVELATAINEHVVGALGCYRRYVQQVAEFVSRAS